MEMFQTERLIARHMKPHDVDALFALCSDPLAMQFMDDGSLLSREECQQWIDVCQRKYAERGYGTSAVVEKASGKFIGICGVIRAPDNNFDEIIYAFDQAYWGKGYGTEAAAAMLDYVFDISALDTIYATINEHNEASIRMMEKLGMAHERDIKEEDADHVTLVYSIQRPEPA